MLFGKAFQDDNQREVSCVKHALPASGTPYSEKTKKANSQRVPEKQTYPLSYKTFTPHFYYIPPLYSGFMKLCETKARKK